MTVAALASLTGAGLLILAWRCDQLWFQRHVFLPYYYSPPTTWASAIRLTSAALGAVVLCFSARIGRIAESIASLAIGPAVWVGTLVALAAAFSVAEGTLRITHLTWRESGFAGYEMKVGHKDPRYGWIAEPSSVTRLSMAGRSYIYAVGPAGLRARTAKDEPDLGRPSLVVTGESIASGYGLDYEDTFAALCGKDLGLEVVDVAEGGYGFDQAYLRVADLLPRIRDPVAVVTLFVPNQLGRSLREDRPRLILTQAGTLKFMAPETGLLAHLQLAALIRDRVPYAGTDALAGSVALAGGIFGATAREARARGAEALFVIVSQGPPRALDAHPEASIIRKLFVDTGLQYLLVDLDETQRFPIDGHPNADGARRIAAAIEATLSRPRIH